MKQSSRYVIAALLIPILALGGLVSHKVYRSYSGEIYTLPIHGYDPRDLLSGHYLIYQVDYGVEGVCSETAVIEVVDAQLCLKPRAFSYTGFSDCEALIEGVCKGRQFTAGIERFYVPQQDASKLEQAVMGRKGSIVLAVGRSGQPVIQDLLIEGVSWKLYLQQPER